MNRIVHSTLSYAKSRKEKKNQYAVFKRKPFTKEVRAFLDPAQDTQCSQLSKGVE